MKNYLSSCIPGLKIGLIAGLCISGCQLIFWLIYLYFNGQVPLAPEVYTGKNIVDTLVLQFPISRWWDLAVPPIALLIIAILAGVYEEINNGESSVVWMVVAPPIFILL